jgi:hypothetical protein
MWKRQSAATSFAPLVLNGKVYILGNDNTMAGHLQIFDANPTGNGNLLNDVSEAIDGWTNFNNLMAATNDRLYLTDGTNLIVADPANGTTLSSFAGAFNGPVAIDANGGIYVHSGASICGFGRTVPVELSMFKVD